RYKAHLMGTAYASEDHTEEWENAIRTLRNGNLYDDRELVLFHALLLDIPNHLVDTEVLINVYHNEVKETTLFVPTLTIFPNYFAKQLEYYGIVHLIVVQTLNVLVMFWKPKNLRSIFYKATELARSLGIPRVYMAANSGARIGLAEEVMNHFN
ncbi:19057_t:CDS:2, partial [Funneliformis geosporum]